MFFKIGVLEKFKNFTGKYLQACNLIKKRLQHRCFPVKFAKFLRTLFYRTPQVASSTNKHSPWWRLAENVFNVTISCFPRRLKDDFEDKKFLHFIMIKKDNRFVILLDFGYVLHHCNARKFLNIRKALLNERS